MALIGINRDELDLSQLPKDSLYDPKRDDDISGVQVKATITFRITNPDGTVVKEWTEPAHSLNYNFGLLIWALWGATTAVMTDTAGVNMNVNGASGGAWSVTAPSGNTSYCIVVGSGATAGSVPSATAYKLVA